MCKEIKRKDGEGEKVGEDGQKEKKMIVAKTSRYLITLIQDCFLLQCQNLINSVGKLIYIRIHDTSQLADYLYLCMYIWICIYFICKQMKRCLLFSTIKH